MAENPFRILLDFRELNFKFYKFVWMSISPRELVTIRDLKDAVLKKFSIEPTELQLFLRDGLLPEDENITNILRENDSVRLFYAKPNQNEVRTVNNEILELSSNDVQVKSSKKRKSHSDVLEDSHEQAKSIKRKHSFSDGTYVFKNNSTHENSALINTIPDNIKSITSTDLYNFESEKRESGKVRKKLKYTNDISQNVSENSTLSSGVFPRSEKNESKANSCKKKKKHSKDFSENEIVFYEDIAEVSEQKKNEPNLHKKKKKHKHSPSTSKLDYVSETGASFYDEMNDISEKIDSSEKDLETINELSEVGESIFETVTENSEVLKLAPVSFSTSSINTSSGIGSLKGSEKNKLSSEQNCCKSSVSDCEPVPEIERNNLSVSQGNNCKKKKRKRNRKRKSLLINPLVDETNDCSFDMSPQKKESLNSSCTSASYQITEISPRNKESSKSNAFLSVRNTNSSETRSGFLEPFTSCVPSTSTPFLPPHVFSSAFPRKNNIFKMANSSNASQDQSCFVATSQKTISPNNPKKTNENSFSTHSSASSVAKNKNATVLNHNFHEKSLSTQINNSSAESAVSFSNLGIKSHFLDPNFSYEDCPPLNSCPLAGSHIAYKVLELDASYSPVVSNYKEGIVKAVNSQTDELEIELIEPEVIEGRTGKFENLYNDELPSCEVVRKVTLNWPSLIAPVRVIY